MYKRQAEEQRIAKQGGGALIQYGIVHEGYKPITALIRYIKDKIFFGAVGFSALHNLTGKLLQILVLSLIHI